MPITLSDFVTDYGHHSNTPCWQTFEFPSGLTAQVMLSTTPFRFFLEVDRPDGGLDTFDPLTSEQVEERLTRMASQLRLEVA